MQENRQANPLALSRAVYSMLYFSIRWSMIRIQTVSDVWYNSVLLIYWRKTCIHDIHLLHNRSFTAVSDKFWCRFAVKFDLFFCKDKNDVLSVVKSLITTYTTTLRFELTDWGKDGHKALACLWAWLLAADCWECQQHSAWCLISFIADMLGLTSATVCRSLCIIQRDVVTENLQWYAGWVIFCVCKVWINDTYSVMKQRLATYKKCCTVAHPLYSIHERASWQLCQPIAITTRRMCLCAVEMCN